MRTTARLAAVTTLLAAGSACGWFAGSDEQTLILDPSTAEVGPTCRPKGLDDLGDPPWAAGHTTTSGWTVASVDATHMEYIRVAFEKGEDKTVLEIAHNKEGAADDWATEAYRLMPAPDETPPEELLNDAIAELRAFAAAESGVPFVKRTEGIVDPYQGLPPCEE